MESPTGSCDEGHTWSDLDTIFPDDLCYKTTGYNGLMCQKESQKDETFCRHIHHHCNTPNRLEDKLFLDWTKRIN